MASYYVYNMVWCTMYIIWRPSTTRFFKTNLTLTLNKTFSLYRTRNNAWSVGWAFLVKALAALDVMVLNPMDSLISLTIHLTIFFTDLTMIFETSNFNNFCIWRSFSRKQALSESSS